MHRRVAASLLALLCATALLVAGLASGQTSERVRMADIGEPLAQALPPGVFLVLVSPPEYTRTSAAGLEGRWTGPEYWASGRRELGGRAAIEWKLRFDNRSPNSLEAAQAAVELGWKESLRGGISIPHVVAGRDVGTFDGDFVLAVAPEPAEAAHEAALAFPIAPRLHAIVNFVLREPSRASAGEFGEYIVNSVVRAPTWNRGQAFRAMAGVRVEGNLPPTRISARASRGGTRILGTVADAFRHPLVGARVGLERQAGGGWQRLTTTRTNARGNYSVRIGRRGTYRATVTVGTATVTSAPVTAGSR